MAFLVFTFSQSADAWNIEADQELRIDSYSLSAP